MDYAGIANRYIKSTSGGAKDLKTSYSGTVTERTLDDGRALVSVDLKTKDALTYVVAPQHQYASGTLLLGYRAPDVVAGAAPALADCQLKVDVVLARPGDPLPDLLQILAFPATGQEVRRMTFEGTGRGALHAAYGVPEGTAGKVQVTQIGAWNATSHSPNRDGFPAEHVNISVGK